MTRVQPRSTVRRVLMAITVLCAACGGDDDGLTGPGDIAFEANYTATVSGAVTQTIAGTAIFGTGTDPESGEQAWIVYLVTDPNSPLSAGSSVFFFGLGAPDIRSYTLEDFSQTGDVFPDGGVAAFVLVYDGQTLDGIFNSTGGSLTVSSLSETRMDGTFSFSATGTAFVGGTPADGSVTVQGSFEARGGSFLVPFGT